MGYTGYGEKENAIEFLKDEKTATCTFTQGKYISKVRRLAEKYPDECKIVAENKDGSVVARLPVGWIKISANKKDAISDEARQASSERLKQYWQDKRNGQNV